MKAAYLEAFNFGDGAVRFRFACQSCEVEGSLRDSLNEADTDKHQHDRANHKPAETVQA